MTLVGILHAVITAIIQIYETFVANGFSFTFLGHLFNIFGALIGWIIAGITTTILITSVIGIFIIIIILGILYYYYYLTGKL